jgi:DNA-binding PadR family transcriptional regulator
LLNIGRVRWQPTARPSEALSPIAVFSDSPGSIYPALGRLEARGLVRSEVERRGGLRQRRLFRLTTKGAAELQRWQKQPVTRDDVVRGLDSLMLRFAFMDESLGRQDALEFLTEFERELREYVPTLRAYLDNYGAMMSLSGRLALESGIGEYEGRMKWVRGAIKSYGKEKKRS